MHFSTFNKSTDRGFSLVEIIVTSAIISLVFGGLLLSVKFALEVLGRSKASAGALTLANERMEFVHSLAYDNVGTIGSPPYGLIPQNSTTTLNGIEYAERVLVTYIDDVSDGCGSADDECGGGIVADTNAIIDDYKLVKIEYTWSIKGKGDALSLISNIVPVGIESTTGGGTIRVNVFDATVNPVETASVHFVNNTLPTTTDTIRFTNNAGVAFLSGAPAGANYEITVTKAGYSVDGTYAATTSNPAPSTLPVAVATSTVSTMTFFVDETSDMLIRTINPVVTSSFEDVFDTSLQLIATSSTVVTGGLLQLEDTLGVYELTGTAQSTSTTPVTILEWETLYFDATVSALTTVQAFVYYDNAGTMTLVPASDLSGNDTGFISSPIDISGLSVGTYPTLGVGATLTTIDTIETPTVDSWGLTYVVSEAVIPSVDFRLYGAKTIGVNGTTPVYKYDQTLATDASGEIALTDLEYDIYDIELITGDYNIAQSCGALPFALNPNLSEELTLTLVPASSEALRVLVTEADATPIAGATVRLEIAGIDQSSPTSLCGQTFFNSGLYASSSYSVTVSKPGYTTEVETEVSVTTGTSNTQVILNP
ncbi:MAG: prepilin-type N-terminal cleavage/methylation domain-containing protein [Candidatus Azotimanducaceae bacterium]|jgi:prepilin-type N-terminal cleavage/methylation domain-containing protein